MRTSRILPYLVLLQAGFTVPRTVTSRAVRSYRTISPLPEKVLRTNSGGIFSVALSMGSRPPGVTWRLVRRSPDFPLQAFGVQRLSGQLLLSRARSLLDYAAHGVNPRKLFDKLLVIIDNDNLVVIME